MAGETQEDSELQEQVGCVNTNTFSELEPVFEAIEDPDKNGRMFDNKYKLTHRS